MDSRRVVITGLGVVTSIGIGKDEFWRNLIAGKSGISEVSAFDTSQHFTHRGGEVKNFNPEDFIEKEKIPLLSRPTQLALAAAKFAVDDAKLNLKKRNDVAACMGTTMGSIHKFEHVNELFINNKHIDPKLICPIPTNTTSSFISHYFEITAPSYIFSTACSAGNYAIGYGRDLIILGKANIGIVGGFDAFLRVAFTGFNQFGACAPEKCLPFDKNRKGMMVAEGSGVLVIESLEHAQKRGAHIYGEIIGYGLTCDAYHMTTPLVDSIIKCMEKALTDAQISAADVDYISAHGTGTPANDRTECAAITKVFGDRYKNIPTSSIKSMIGHTMGAASAIEAITCALVVKHDIIPPTINYETPDPECDIDCVPNKAKSQRVAIALNNSYAFGGNNASLVIKKFVE
jgi:3-oxoacyl-[acyl-carrier-protein] synthase II